MKKVLIILSCITLLSVSGCKKEKDSKITTEETTSQEVVEQKEEVNTDDTTKSSSENTVTPDTKTNTTVQQNQTPAKPKPQPKNGVVDSNPTEPKHVDMQDPSTIPTNEKIKDPEQEKNVTYKTVDDYINSKKAEFDQFIADAAKQGINMKVYSENNSLVYDCGLDVELPDSGVKALKETTEGQAEEYQKIVAQMRAVVPNAKSFIMRYRDKNGKELLSKEFK